ncbi:hypothetical protein mRhiFer1_007820 [Rhinolophus ferrumequinum]|uniref:L antigen family member 3 n=1 Tax=Rhinolophus ferrumequinum TaxID=59479 RepID=A0A7J8AVU7_RHIFE|nr:hypothetical protein mRhiFer1_007820 [Rhinolophus ferrumequinum]
MKIQVVRLMQGVAPAVLKTWVSPVFWKANVLLAALVALVALEAPTTSVALAVPMASTLTLPFQSYLEAELARLAMDTDAQRHWQGVEKEVIVTDNVLAVWIAENPDLLRVSINSFLEQLSVVVRNIQRIRPLLPPSISRKKGVGT